MTFKNYISVLRKAFQKLRSGNPLRLAGATAFFTTFALPAVLIILLQAIGLFYNSPVIKKGIFAQLQLVLGRESSIDISNILNQMQNLSHNWLVTVGGFIFLLFVATTLFRVVSSSINDLWRVKLKKNAGIAFYLKLRIKSLVIILLAGLLVMVQLGVSAIQALLRNYINELWGSHHFLLYKIISQVIFIVIVTGWFTILFKFLANAHPQWNIAFTGGLFTGILFTAGKIILGLLLTFGNLKTIFGASGSFVLILLFVFYASFIFYYGAAFTQVWSNEKNKEMRLEKHAYFYSFKEGIF